MMPKVPLRMKGISLPINTMVIIIMAFLVLAVLLFFFTSTSTPALEIVQLKQEQSTLCFSYKQANPDCDTEGDSKVSNTELRNSIADTCNKLNQHEKNYPSCTSASTQCMLECCCGGGAEDCKEALGGTCVGLPCSKMDLESVDGYCPDPNYPYCCKPSV